MKKSLASSLCGSKKLVARGRDDRGVVVAGRKRQLDGEPRRDGHGEDAGRAQKRPIAQAAQPDRRPRSAGEHEPAFMRERERQHGGEQPPGSPPRRGVRSGRAPALARTPHAPPTSRSESRTPAGRGRRSTGRRRRRCVRFGERSAAKVSEQAGERRREEQEPVEKDAAARVARQRHIGFGRQSARTHRRTSGRRCCGSGSAQPSRTATE